MGIKKRVSAFLLAVSLSFGVCATDYLEVQALEWAGVTIGLDTALKFLLGLVGVSVGVGVADSIDWTETRENCIQFQQNQGNSAVAVSNWWADVIRGKLDTASDCWSSFKEWVNELINGNTSVSASTVSNAILSRFPNCNNINSLSSETLNFEYSCGYSYSNAIYLFQNCSIDCYQSYIHINALSDAKSVYFVFGNDGNIGNLNSYASKPHSISSYDDSTSVIPFYIYGEFVNRNPDKYVVWNIPSSDIPIPGQGDFESAFSNVTDIGLGSSIATDLPQEGILDIPWENVGDTAESVDGAIDNALENVNTGTWTLDQYWEYVQNITNVYAYDITNNYLLPNDGSNETTEDKVQENVSRGAFVLAGLEKVFPFCIPWDIYAFVTLLVADPVAPVIEYPIYNPVTDSEEIITIDFSVWEDQVVIMRYIFDFLLIIGLLLLARSLIGAGGSD